MIKVERLGVTDILGKEIVFYGSWEDPLFLVVDIANWIEHTHTTNMIKSVDDDEKLNAVVFDGFQRREMTLIAKDGLKKVLVNSRKRKAKELLEYITDEMYQYIHTPLETRFSGTLHSILKDIYKISEQYNVDGYKLDFYIKELNLAIEYDEVQHKFQLKEDVKRQRHIKDKLGCDFIRVKEGEESEGINSILKYIIKHNHNIVAA